MSVVDASLEEEPMRLGNGGYLAFLHGLFERFERFIGDQLFRTTLMDPADQKLFESAFSVAGEPPLALTPAVAQGFGRLFQIATLSRLKEPEHPHSVEQVAVAMALFELL